MPRDLFGDVTDPSVRVGSRKWYTVPLSLAVHTIVLLAIVVIPLMATGVLPVPNTKTTFVAIEVPALPAPPPVRRAPQPQQPSVSRDAAPVTAPDAITLESPFDSGDPDAAGEPVDTGIGELLGVVVADAPPAPPPPTPPAPVRVGGNVRAPEKIADASPTYPPIAQAAHVQGIVIIEATIGIDGRVQNARVLRSVPLLDEAAVAAVRQWVYTPTLLNGVPVPVIMTVTVRFQLQ